MNDKILWELRQLVWDVLEEAKKKKKEKVEPRKDGYSYSEAFDFSEPLGDWNLLKRTGGASWGPLTGAGTAFDQNKSSARSIAKAAVDVAIRPYIKESVREFVAKDPSAWTHLAESKPVGVWETAMSEAHVGFAKLKGKLAHKKGVKNPAGLAAKIGRDKFGKKGMAKKAAAGKK